MQNIHQPLLQRRIHPMHIIMRIQRLQKIRHLLTLLIRFGLMSTQTLARGRRYAVVILLTIAAFITPPDILSQVLLFIPLYALYEVSIVIGRMIERRRVVEEKEIVI